MARSRCVSRASPWGGNSLNRRILRAAAVLAPLGTAALLMPLADRPLPAWAASSLLAMAVRILDGAAGRAFGRPDPSFLPEALLWAAPFAVRILSLLSAPGFPDLFAASALWAGFYAAAAAAECAASFRGRRGFPAFAAALAGLAAFTAVAGSPAGTAGAALTAAGLVYSARRRLAP